MKQKTTTGNNGKQPERKRERTIEQTDDRPEERTHERQTEQKKDITIDKQKEK